MKGKPYLLICWLCRMFIIVEGNRAAGETCDHHALSKHRRSDWTPFMACEAIDTAIETRSDMTLAEAKP